MQFLTLVRRPSPSNLARRTVAFSIAMTALLAFTHWSPPTAPASEASGDEGIVVQQVETPPAQVESSWSAEDFANAKPAEIEPSPDAAFDVPDFPDAAVSARRGPFTVKDPSTIPQRLHGKVFFRLGNELYTCSATLISSRYGNAVFTAGHCLYDIKQKRFADDFIFAPGLNNGIPLQIYPATSLSTTRAWTRKGSFAGDIGIATLSGTPVADMGGGRPVAFNLNPKRRKFTIFGYPSDPAPYDGAHLYGCNARVAGRDRGRPRPLAAYPCPMGHGTSGGGWISHGFLNSVSSYFYCETNPKACGYLFGPYFGKSARKLYTRKQVGGSIDPIIAISKHPKRKTTKRKVRFRFISIASTPLRWRCKLDRHRWRKCGAKTTVSRLSRGKHTLKVKAYDQTGRRSINSQRFRFTVKRR